MRLFSFTGNPRVSFGPQPGMRLGDYHIERQIGAGGMATVWLARHIPLDRFVALKILRDDFASDRRNLLRFTREARSAARLDSPAIVRIYEVGQFGAIHPPFVRFLARLRGKPSPLFHYIAEEYVPGMNLAEYVRRIGVLSVGQVIAVMTDVARALESAYAAGVVHRDIKPENILVSETGKIKVADFGLAFYNEENRSTDLSLTRIGVTLGTPLYMSPEQGEGKQTDVRSDLYSLGSAAFWMLTGRPPYEGGSPMSVILRHASAEIPDPRAFRPETPDALAGLVIRLMAKRPEERFDTPSQLIGQLAQIEKAVENTPLFSGDPEEKDASENEFLAEQKTRLNFTRELSVLSSVRRLQNTLLEEKQINKRNRLFWSLSWTTAFLLAIGTALLAGMYRTRLRNAGNLRPHSEIQRLETVEQQWVFAMQTETSQAWRSLLRFYPDDPYWTVKAKKLLALALMDEGQAKDAQSIFDSFASGEAEGIAGIAFGLAGRAWVYAVAGDTVDAAFLLSELRQEGKSFDPQTEAVIAKTNALMRGRQ